VNVVPGGGGAGTGAGADAGVEYAPGVMVTGPTDGEMAGAEARKLSGWGRESRVSVAWLLRSTPLAMSLGTK